MPKNNILIVEDNRVIAEDIKLSLNKMGYKVCAIIAYGEKLVSVAEEMKPDLVLMDIMLKGRMNGIDAARLLKDRFDIPVVYLTAYADEDILQRAKMSEPNGYIIKPFDEKDLKVAVEIALYKHHMERKLKESKEWFATTLSSIGDAVIATDSKGVVSFLNSVAEELTGWKEDEAIGKPLTEVFHIVNEFSREPVDDPVQKVIQTGLVVGLANHTVLISKDGRKLPIKDSGAPIQNNRGDLVGVVMVFQDITKARKTEIALKKSEAYYRSLISNLHEDILVINRNYEITDVNNTFLISTGHNRTDVIGRFCHEIAHAYNKPCHEVGEECMLKDVFESGKPCSTIHKHQNKDGLKVYVDITLSPLKDSDGKVTHVIEAVRDITDLMHTKVALQESEEKYRTLVESSTDAILMLNKDRVIVSCNQACLVLFGYERKEMEGQPARMIHPSDESFNSFGKASYPAIENYGTYTTELEILHKDGSLIPVETTTSLLKSSDASKGGYVAILRDITKRRQADEYRIRLETAIEQAAEGVMITDAEGMIQYVNPALERITGYSREEITKQNPKIFQSGKHDEAFYRSMWKTLTSGKIWQGHFINKRKDNSIYEEDTTIAPIKNATGKIVNYVAVKRDVTDEINRERQLRQGQKMEAIGTLAGGIAHDFNNILAAIIGYSEIALDKTVENTPLHANLQEVFNAGIRAKGLVKQILTFSRQAEQELQPVQVKLMIKEALKLIRASLPATIKIRLNIQSDNAVLADPTHIHQILMNLCTNAGHAMRETGGILDVSLIDEVLDSAFAAMHPDVAPGAYLRLTVSDTGHGISDEVIEKIFDPFFTTKELEEGTGMGLAVVHGIVKGCGGIITVDSEEGKGANFKVYLPVISLDEKPRIKKTDPLPAGTEHILFVDDEKTLVDMGKEMLEKRGYVVTTRTSSIEALELFKAKPEEFDIVITDLTMPNMTGKDLAKKIIEIRPDIPIVICTGFSVELTAEAIKAAGIKAVIHKPIISAELFAGVRRGLNSVGKK